MKHNFNTTKTTISALVLFAIVLGLSLFYHNVLRMVIPEIDRRGQFGDSFGAFNGVFTAMAFLIMAISLYYQRKDYLQTLLEFEKQTSEFKKQTSEFEKQRELLEKERLDRIEENAPILSIQDCAFNWIPDPTLSEQHPSAEYLMIKLKNKGGLVTRLNYSLQGAKEIQIITDIAAQIFSTNDVMDVRFYLDGKSCWRPEEWPKKSKFTINLYGNHKIKVTQVFEIIRSDTNLLTAISTKHDITVTKN